MEHVLSHWTFFVFLLIDLIVWFFLIRFFTKKSTPKSPENPGDNKEDDDGIFYPEDPRLDLPPGVMLPKGDPVLEPA